MKPPRFLTRLGRICPPPLAALPFAAGLEVARQRGWLVPPTELEGRHFELRVRDLGLAIRFSCCQGRFRPHFGKSELTLSADAADFVALAKGSADPDTLFFQRRLAISGDTELGLIVKNWLDASERPAWLQRLFKQESS